jgi:hypothetical protein
VLDSSLVFIPRFPTKIGRKVRYCVLRFLEMGSRIISVTVKDILFFGLIVVVTEKLS